MDDLGEAGEIDSDMSNVEGSVNYENLSSKKEFKLLVEDKMFLAGADDLPSHWMCDGRRLHVRRLNS